MGASNPPCGYLSYSCSDKNDGLYIHDDYFCPFYYKCENGELTDRKQCSDGLFFDNSTGRCKHGSEIDGSMCGIPGHSFCP